jgi:hypothetical protein
MWAGAWLGSSVSLSLVTLGVTFAVLLGIAAFAHRLPTVARVAIVVVVLAAASMTIRVVQLDLGPVAALATQQAHVEISGVITQDPTFEDRLTFGGTSDRQVRVIIRAEQVSFGTQQSSIRDPILVIGDAAGWEDLHVGDNINTSGQLRNADQNSPLAAVLFADAVSVTARAPAILKAAESMRSGLREATAGTSDDVRGLLPALVVGDTGAMPSLLVADLRASGLAHLTAVSGANVAIVVASALLLARWSGVRGWTLIAFGLVVVAWFVVLARPQPSVMRAAVMGSVGIVGVAVAGRAQALRALLGSVLLLLMVDPWLSRSWGFEPDSCHRECPRCTCGCSGDDSRGGVGGGVPGRSIGGIWTRMARPVADGVDRRCCASSRCDPTRQRCMAERHQRRTAVRVPAGCWHGCLAGGPPSPVPSARPSSRVALDGNDHHLDGLLSAGRVPTRSCPMAASWLGAGYVRCRAGRRTRRQPRCERCARG